MTFSSKPLSYVTCSALSICRLENRGYCEDSGWVPKNSPKRALIHTFLEVSPEECRIRIISARKANKRETRQYEETQL